MLQARPHRFTTAPFLQRLLLALSLLVVSLQASALNYCAAKGSIFSYEYIKGVAINGLTSTSAGQGYFLFSSPTFNLNTGNNSLTLTPGFNGSSYNEGWSVFIDLNQDGNFTSDERLLATTSYSSITSTLNIPTTAKSGATRLRVILQYSSYFPTGCGTFSYGEVEDYTVNVQGTTPPATKISTTTIIGYDHSYNKDLVIEARYKKDGVTNLSSNFYYANSSNIASPVTFDVDNNTTIEWSAHVYLDDTPAGVYIPASCKTIVGNKCTTTAGAIGETVRFKEQPPVIPPITPDITLTFENIFAGATYKAGPTVDLSNGITATTTAPYVYNPSGAPFTSGYLSFIDVTLNFPVPVLAISFQAAGSCTNCTQTVNVTADGVVVNTFTLDYNQVKTITLNLPTAASKISFNQNFKMDNLGIKFTSPNSLPPTTLTSTTMAGFDQVYNKNLVIEAIYLKNGVSTLSSTAYAANNAILIVPVTLDADVNSKITWSAHIAGDASAAGIFIPAGCTLVIGNSCSTNAGVPGETVKFKQPTATPPPADLTLNFENQFGGFTFKAGPTIDLGYGISATTSGTYFYNPTGAPFTSGYFSFIDLLLSFPSPVLSLSFKAAGSCTNCTQTVNVIADGVLVNTFTLDYNQVKPITLILPVAASKIKFDQNFKMDELAIDYQ